MLNVEKHFSFAVKIHKRSRRKAPYPVIADIYLKKKYMYKYSSTTLLENTIFHVPLVTYHFEGQYNKLRLPI